MDTAVRSVTASTSWSTEEVSMDIFEWMVENIDTVYRIWLAVFILTAAYLIKLIIDIWRDR